MEVNGQLEMQERGMAKFDVAVAGIAELGVQYRQIKVKDRHDKENLALAHTARMDIKGRRISVEKTRKELKEDALKWGQRVDARAKELTALLEPIETHLLGEEQRIENEIQAEKEAAAKARAEKIQARIDRLCEMGASYTGKAYLAHGILIMPDTIESSSDEGYEGLLGIVQQEIDAEHKAKEAEATARRLEEERLKKVAEEQAAEKARLEEARKQAEEAAKTRAEQEAKERALEKEKARLKAEQEAVEREKQRLIDEEKARLKAIEDEKIRVIMEEKRARELEQAKKEAAGKALRDAEEKAERDKAAAEAKSEKARLAAERKAARQPDKVKLMAIVDILGSIQTPDVKTEDGKAVALWAMMEIQSIAKRIMEKVEAL
jgi:hypothetical protein